MFSNKHMPPVVGHLLIWLFTAAPLIDCVEVFQTCTCSSLGGLAMEACVQPRAKAKAAANKNNYKPKFKRKHRCRAKDPATWLAQRNHKSMVACINELLEKNPLQVEGVCMALEQDKFFGAVDCKNGVFSDET